MKNYYDILGVDPNSDLSQIKRAFRKKALQFHPDRGGTHVQMVKINEAWEVLASAELRKQYDDLLRNGGRDNQFFEQASERAQTYEKSWDEFDNWLSAVGRDFTNAQYGSTKLLFFDVPTGKGSLSAWAFIVAGGFIGFCIAASCALSFASEIHENNGARNRMLLILGIGVVTGGAWLGQQLHESIASALKDSRASQAKPSSTSTVEVKRSAPKKMRVGCPSCNQQLKLPALGKRLSVTCPNCRHQFQFKS